MKLTALAAEPWLPTMKQLAALATLLVQEFEEAAAHGLLLQRVTIVAAHKSQALLRAVDIRR